MAGISVQFVGIKEVMKAFDNKDCVNWSVYQGKIPNFSYAGREEGQSRAEWEEWLKMLSTRTNQAVYTLRFYERFSGTEITDKTPYHTAFNFRLFDEEEYGSRSIGYVNRGSDTGTLTELLQDMRNEMRLLREEAKKPAQIGNAEEPLETWEKVLDHPITMGLIGKIFNIDMGSMMALDGKISGIPGDGNINDVIQELWAYDKQLDLHLYKLLQIAKQKPQNFNMLIGMLDKM